MRRLFKSISGYFIGAAILLVPILLATLFIKGGVYLSRKLLPLLGLLMWIIFAIDFLIMLPLSALKKLKSFTSIVFMISSYVYGLTLWFWGLLLTYIIWGFIAVFIGLFMAGVGVVPIAILATAINGKWVITIQLLLLSIFTYGSRVYSLYLAENADKNDY